VRHIALLCYLVVELLRVFTSGKRTHSSAKLLDVEPG